MLTNKAINKANSISDSQLSDKAKKAISLMAIASEAYEKTKGVKEWKVEHEAFKDRYEKLDQFLADQIGEAKAPEESEIQQENEKLQELIDSLQVAVDFGGDEKETTMLKEVIEGLRLAITI